MNPPPSIQWLVNAVGEDEAFAFIEAAGGTRIWVPRGLRPTKLLERHGKNITKALIKEYAGCPYQVPLVKAWRCAILYKKGVRMNEIAMRLGISWRQVQNLITAKHNVDRKISNKKSSMTI